MLTPPRQPPKRRQAKKQTYDSNFYEIGKGAPKKTSARFPHDAGVSTDDSVLFSHDSDPEKQRLSASPPRKPSGVTLTAASGGGRPTYKPPPSKSGRPAYEAAAGSGSSDSEAEKQQLMGPDGTPMMKGPDGKLIPIPYHVPTGE